MTATSATNNTDDNISTVRDDNNTNNDNSYRIYVDIGQEPGTWMEPQWGASGAHIEFTVDVEFVVVVDDSSSTTDGEDKEWMVANNLLVQDNLA